MQIRHHALGQFCRQLDVLVGHGSQTVRGVFVAAFHADGGSVRTYTLRIDRAVKLLYRLLFNAFLQRCNKVSENAYKLKRKISQIYFA
jgi:hypothetical protein